MNRKRYYSKIGCFVMIVIVVFLPLARAQENQSIKNQKVTVIDPSSKRSNEVANTIRGFVTDKLGRPRGNVFIAPQSTNIWRGIRSDTQGRFTLEGVKPDQKKWIAYSQASQAMGLFVIPEDYTDQPIHVILSFNEAVVEGRVVRPDGKGLADRSVELLVKTKHGLTYRFLSFGKTDQYGNYSSRTPCGSGLSIQAKLVDGTEAEKRFATKPFALSDDQITISIPRLAIGEGKPEETDDGKVLYSGRVVNEQGDPLRGVRVDMMFKLDSMRLGRKVTMTDEHGRWRQRLPRDFSDIKIGLLHPEYIKQKWQETSSAELLNGTNVKVMKRGLTLRGTVKNVRGGPIENALIDTGGSGSTTPYGEVIENCTTPRTLADGSFTVGGLAEGGKDIVVSAVGYAPQFVSVEIEDGIEPIEITMKKGVTYIGQVVDIDGSPIEGVEIDVDEWRIGRRRRRIVRITETDSQGNFSIDNLPDEGSLILDFVKGGSGLLSFSKEIPEDISGRDKIVMYKRPVFVGRVIDDETQEPITKFTLINGFQSSLGNSVDWSRYRKKDITSESGAFSINWEGYHISYPFDGFCCLKVEVKGYLPEIARPMKLGQKYESCVIRMTKAEPLKGIVVDNKGNPAVKAEVGWMGPERIAFIKNGKFDKTGFSKQVEIIVKTDSKGLFELPPSRENGMIVALHENGYAIITSRDIKNGSQIELIPWARIKGTIVSNDKSSGEFVLGINTVPLPEGQESPPIRWLFDRTSFSGKHFTIDYVPSTPLHIAQIIQSGQNNPLYIDPQPGETYGVRFGSKGIAVAEKVLPSLMGKILPALVGIKVDFSPEQTKGRMVLICFWDMNQRPSRYCVNQLVKQVQQLKEKGVTVIAVQATKIDENKLNDWVKKNSIPFHVGMIEGDEEKVRFTWGVRSLPWLILTNKESIVHSVGFGIGDLDEKLASIYKPITKEEIEKHQRENAEVEIRRLGGEIIVKTSENGSEYTEVKFLGPRYQNEWKGGNLGAKYLSGLCNLKNLRIQDVETFTDEGMVYIGGLNNLESLMLVRTQVTDNGLSHIKELTNLRFLGLLSNRFTDTGLEYIIGMTNLKSLRLDGTKVTNDGLKRLKQNGLLGAIEFLSLNQTKISNEGLAHLTDMQNLKILYLSDTQVTSVGLDYIGGLTKLEGLILNNTEISDEGLLHLKTLTNLNMLYLRNTQITSIGLAHLEKMTNLIQLWMGGTKITDTGLEYLKALNKLESLDLSRTQVTNSGLSHLEGLTSLNELFLNYTGVTVDGYLDLNEALPDCQIYWKQKKDGEGGAAKE